MIRLQHNIQLNRHDKLQDILINNANHPIIKKLDINIQALIAKSTTTTIDATTHLVPHSLLPLNYSLKDSSKLTSKQIRLGLYPPIAPTPKLLINPDPDITSHLGRCLKKMTNSKLQGILL